MVFFRGRLGWWSLRAAHLPSSLLPTCTPTYSHARWPEQILLAVLDAVGSGETRVRELALLVLRDVVKAQPDAFGGYINMVLQRLVRAAAREAVAVVDGSCLFV